MKRFLNGLLVIVLLLTACTAFAETAQNVYLGDMQVVHCTQWISLRAKPDVDSQRLAEVPLGAVVNDCYVYSKEFIYCEYQGIYGYLLSDYLIPYVDEGSDDFVEVPMGEYVGDMQIYNCSWWVSLRSGPDSDAARLAEVPLGAWVNNCFYYNDEYAYCEYNSICGYIHRDYLLPYQQTAAYKGIDYGNYARDKMYMGELTVVNCEDYVSLRQYPDTGSARVAKVRLGAMVTNCYDYSDDFILCEYSGQTGFILREYLYACTDKGVYVPYNNVYSFGAEVLNWSGNGGRVLAHRSYINGGEALLLVCCDENYLTEWSYYTETQNVTELTMTDAFIGGAASNPQVMVYNAEQGLTALDLYTGREKWTLPIAALDLGGSICHDVDDSGVMYVGGYYGPDPVAIDSYGNVLWQSSAGKREIYWLSDIEVTYNGIAASYGHMNRNGDAGRVHFNWNGKIMWWGY